MTDQSFQYRFTTSEKNSDVFQYLLDPCNWWTGLFGEIIEGSSKQPGDVFSFRAGDGVHYSKQQLTELVPGEKITWLVTESNLSFLKNTNEWTGTKICFNLEQEGDQTRVTFTHAGLEPAMSCYGSCSNAWTQYLQKLALQLHA